MKFIPNTLLLSLFFTLVSMGINQRSMATHIVGGEITAEYIRKVGSNWEYRILIKVYRDCGPSSSAQLDNPLTLTIFDSIGNVFRLDTIHLPSAGPVALIPYINNPCLVTPPNICTEVGLYERKLMFPITSGGYTVTYQRCCRNAGIVNLSNPGGTGASYTTRIPGTTEIGTFPNSTPEFNDYPPMILCLNDPLIFDHSATDSDGDSLVYELCSPYHGGGPNGNNGPNGPIPIPSTPPPYSYLIWGAGYSAAYQMSSNPPMAIDPVTGLLTGTPNGSGKYVVGICVSEYRNGMLLSTNTRDFQFTVTYCDPNAVAAASTQDRFCDGLEVSFTDSSQNAWSYFWDFGDPTTTSDTSNISNPTYKYPDTGKYMITLIINRGYTCADTIVTEYSIYETLEPFFTPPLGQCFDEHAIDLNAEGLFQQYAQFAWEFGTSAVTSGSFDKNPRGVKFKEPGTFPVKLIIRENGCEEFYIDTVKIYPNPEIYFDVAERSNCAPATIQFSNNSNAWSPITYLWQFGDGEASTEPTPTHYYPIPGVYDVTLFASISEVCTTTTKLTKENLIQINAVPVAALHVDRLVASVIDPVITFKNITIEKNKCWLDLGDGIESTSCDYVHHYWNPGRYIVTQIVETPYGCKDSNYLEILINPEISVFIPNSFTPNHDGKNEVYKPIGEVVFDYVFEIYDRWGKLVYTTKKLENGWNGNIDGNFAPVDTYVYHVKFNDVAGESHEYRGTFSLLR